LPTSEDGKIDVYYFLKFNANKKSIPFDLKSEHGLVTVEELAKKGDVVIENLVPDTIEPLGLGYDVIKAINPDIICIQIKRFRGRHPL
jgi:crotonobetainyl-CoA:carnitine CoA-transferase CaiB-like acyl-CoA transferase